MKTEVKWRKKLYPVYFGYTGEGNLRWTKRKIDRRTIYFPIVTKVKFGGDIFRKHKARFAQVDKGYLQITLYKQVVGRKYIVIIAQYSNLKMVVNQAEEIFEDVLMPYWIKYYTLGKNDSNWEFVKNLLQIGYEIDMQDNQMYYFLNNANMMVLAKKWYYINMIQGLYKAGYGKENRHQKTARNLKLHVKKNEFTICDKRLIQEMENYSKGISWDSSINVKSFQNGITALLRRHMTEYEFFKNTIFFRSARRYGILEAGTKVQIIWKNSHVSFGIAESDIYWKTGLTATTSIQLLIIEPNQGSKKSRKIGLEIAYDKGDCLVYNVLRALCELECKKLLPMDKI